MSKSPDVIKLSKKKYLSLDDDEEFDYNIAANRMGNNIDRIFSQNLIRDDTTEENSCYSFNHGEPIYKSNFIRLETCAPLSDVES